MHKLTFKYATKHFLKNHVLMFFYNHEHSHQFMRLENPKILYLITEFLVLQTKMN